MALNTNKKEGDKLHAEEWNELAQEVQGKQSRLNIVDALDSTSSVDVLSAKQGKVLNDKINNTLTDVKTISEKVNKLPTGYYYGQFESVNSLPDASQLTQRGYAYIASEDASVYYIYLFNGEGSSWEDSGNKFVTTELESDLETKSQTKAPTTKAVAESIEGVNLTTEKSLTDSQKYTALVNINDRDAEINSDTNNVERYAYKLLDANLSITNQILNDNNHKNTIYEIRDKFNLNNATLTIPSGCILRFNGGTISNGKINGNSTKIEASNYQIFYNISFSGSFSDSLNACWVGARNSDTDYDNSPILQKWFGGTFESPDPVNGWCRYWKVMKWPTGTYYFKSQVSSGEDNSSYNRFLCLDMDNSIFRINITENVNSDTKSNPSFLVINVENFTLRNGQIRKGASSGTGDFSRVNCINILAKGQRFTLENITISNFDAGVYLYNLWYGNFIGQCDIIYNRVGVFVRGTLDFNTVDFNGIVMKPASLVTTIQKYPMIVGEPVVFEALGEVNIDNSTYKYGPVSTLYKPRQRLIIWDSQNSTWKLVNNSPSSYKNTGSSSQTLYLSEEYIGNNNEDESLVVHIEGGENIEEKVYSPFTDSNTTKTTINNQAFIKSYYSDGSSRNQKITLAPNYTVKYNLMKALDVAKVRLASYSNSTYSVLSYKTGFRITTDRSYTVVSSDRDATEALISLNGEEQVIPLTRDLTIGNITYRASAYNALQITATPETPVTIKYNHNPSHLISHTDNLSSKIIDIENIIYNEIYIPITNATDTSTLKYFVNTESYDEWMLRKARVGIDIHTFTSSCKFVGLTIEGFDYGMRFNWKARSSSNASEKSSVNISNCYFEANTTYDLYFGEGWLDNTENYSYKYRYTTYANVFNNKFNSSKGSGNRIFFENGVLCFRNNVVPHGAEGASVIESKSNANWYTTCIKNESNWKVTTENGNFYNIKEDTRINTLGTLGFSANGYLGNISTASNLYTRADAVLENDKYNKTQTLPLNTFNYGNYATSKLYTFRKDSIKTGSTVNISDGIDSFPIINVGRSSYPFAYVHSGRNVVITNLDSGYAPVSQTIDGIPIREFIARWKNGISYTGLVQGLFPYKVVARPSTGLIKRESDNVIVGFGNYYLANSKYIGSSGTLDKLNVGKYIYIDALIVVEVPTAGYDPRYYCDLVQCGRLYNEIRPTNTSDENAQNDILIPNIQNISNRISFVNRVLFSISDGNTYIYTSSATWTQLTSPFSRYTFQAVITKKANRPLVADYQGETCFCKSTGITYTFAFKTSVASAQNATWYGSIGTVFSLEHPNNYDASTNPVTYATELDAGEMVRCNGRLYIWNGNAFTDVNGEITNLTVSDTTILLGAAAPSSKTVNVYYPTDATVTVDVQNPDGTPNTDFIVTPNPFTGNTLTITATAANTTSAPIGVKIIVSDGTDVKIINVIQSY